MTWTCCISPKLTTSGLLLRKKCILSSYKVRHGYLLNPKPYDEISVHTAKEFGWDTSSFFVIETNNRNSKGNHLHSHSWISPPVPLEMKPSKQINGKDIDLIFPMHISRSSKNVFNLLGLFYAITILWRTWAHQHSLPEKSDAFSAEVKVIPQLSFSGHLSAH